MTRCQIKTAKKDAYQIVEFHGHIDENFMSVANTIPDSDNYIFNFKNLLSINSSGIREWIIYAKKLTKAKVLLAECPKPFIDQASMVEGFLPEHFIVHSFYVPYYCEASDQEKLVLATNGKDFGPDFNTIKTQFTDTDSAEYEIDVVPAKYFKFLAKR